MNKDRLLCYDFPSLEVVKVFWKATIASFVVAILGDVIDNWSDNIVECNGGDIQF